MVHSVTIQRLGHSCVLSWVLRSFSTWPSSSLSKEPQCLAGGQGHSGWEILQAASDRAAGGHQGAKGVERRATSAVLGALLQGPGRSGAALG